MTVLEALRDAIRAKDLALDGEVRPAAILWTDPNGEWKGCLDLLRDSIPELLMLGEYDTGTRTGPAIWLRCVIDGPLREGVIPEDVTPIVYMPGVMRSQLQAGKECPEPIRPLVELMYRGTAWLQKNGSDWTARAFLGSNQSLGLDIAGDQATSEAIVRAMPEVLTQQVDQLRGRKITAAEFDKLLSDDHIRDLLQWIGNPDRTRARLGETRWDAFVNQCRDALDFDPSAKQPFEAGELLGKGEGNWKAAWQRYTESPSGYPGVVEILRKCRPNEDLFGESGERWPDLNDEKEESIRKSLQSLSEMNHRAACDLVCELEQEHAVRRNWVWAKLGLSPLAMNLKPLSQLASGARQALKAAEPNDYATRYADDGWLVDAAAWEAIAAAPVAERALIRQVVHHLLVPWLEQSTINFATSLEGNPLPQRREQQTIEAEPSMCLLFVDGLRYDVGQRLAEQLEERGYAIERAHRWAALPTVTATAKPAVSPAEPLISGTTLGESFAPSFEDDKKEVAAASLRKRLADRGYQILRSDAAPWPAEEQGKGWKEFGQIDKRGHDLEWELAVQLPSEIETLTEEIAQLLKAGWKSVRVVTDHGWLLAPCGLPNADLPKHLTTSRWARCAVITAGNTPDVSLVEWHWNSTQHFAVPPGISCYNASRQYAHGGISLQECLIPDLVVRGDTQEATARVTIRSISWRGFRCDVKLSTGIGSPVVDLRLGGPSGMSVVAKAKSVDDLGEVNLVLSDDEYSDADLTLVVTDKSGSLLTQLTTRVGENT